MGVARRRGLGQGNGEDQVRPLGLPATDPMDTYLANGWTIDAEGQWTEPAAAVEMVPTLVPLPSPQPAIASLRIGTPNGT